MATVGTVTVEVTPVLPKDATEQIETAVRAAIAEALRNLADGLVATPAAAVKEDISLWGYTVGDHVKYTAEGAGCTGDVRVVQEILDTTAARRISLGRVVDGPTTGYAWSPVDIEPAW